MTVLTRRLRKLLDAFPPLPGAIVLGYHRIADPAEAPGGDPYALCVSPEVFERQMASLRRFGRPVSLTHLASTLAAGESVRGMIAVTFDDAYRSVFEAALPVLEREEIPATVFFVSGNQGEPFWWDRLVALMAGAEVGAAFRLTSDDYEIRWTGNGSRRELAAHLHRALSILPEASRRDALDRLAEVWRSVEPDTLPRAVTSSEARELLASKWVDAGSHSVSHPPLAAVPPDRAREEIERSRGALQDRFAAEISAFSFPHGSHDDVTVDAVRRAGYETACTTRSASIRAGADPLRLPRFWPRDDTGLSFQRLRLYTGAAIPGRAR